MKKNVIIKSLLFLFFILNYVSLSAQSDLERKILIKDSLLHNKYNKGKLYLAGALGGDFVFSSPKFFVDFYSIENVFCLGYFIKDRNLILSENTISYGRNYYKEYPDIKVWNVMYSTSLGYRHYLKPRKFTFFVEGMVDYFAFYSEDSFLTDLPAKLFHIGMLTPGAGVELFVYKYNFFVISKYHFPIIYSNDVKKYKIFQVLNVDYLLGLSYTF